MSKANVARVRYALKGIVNVAKALPTEERSALKAVAEEYFRKEDSPGCTNQELFIFASAVHKAGQNLMALAQSNGSPASVKRSTDDTEYAKSILVEVGLMDKPSKVVAEEPEEEEEPEESKHPTKYKVMRMSKKQIRLYCETHFDVDVEMTDSLAKLRKQMWSLIEDDS